MRKRFPAMILALALCIGLAVPVQAARVSDTAGQNLTRMEQKIYKALEDAILAVTAGNGTSTEVNVPITRQDATWTAQELSLSKIDNDNVEDPLNDVIGKSMDKVFRCLKVNRPFEMFWVGNNYNWTWWQEHTDSQVWLTSLTCSIDVIESYRGGSKTTVDPAKIAQAKSVVKTAESIVAANAGKSNYEKLAAYRDEICARNTYNNDANNALLKDEYAYGDPWQLIYVFDDDPSTNALCEGYAKAFKYLCDLSDFDGDVTCYIAEGYGGDERHMWNVVRMEDGKFYLADITYSDNSQIGKDSVFMVNASGNGERYVVSAGSREYTYTYLEDQEGLFTDGFLPISSTPYTPGTNPPTPDPQFTDVPAWCSGAVDWAVEQNITDGKGGGRFAPGDQCTNAEILTFLWRAAGKPASSAPLPADITGKNISYAETALRWAAERGMADQGIDPLALCTRGSAMIYIWKAFDEIGADGADVFIDVPAESETLFGAVYFALACGITNGYANADGTFSFRPDKVCTRGEIVTFLHRAYVPEASLVSDF